MGLGTVLRADGRQAAGAVSEEAPLPGEMMGTAPETRRESVFHETVEEAVSSCSYEIILTATAAQMYCVPGRVSATETVMVSDHRPAFPIARPVAARRSVCGTKDRAPMRI